MIVLGIDPGTLCGWAILGDDGQAIGSGVWDLKPRRHEGGGMRYLRLRTYLDQARHSLGRRDFDAVAYEEVRRHMGTDAAQIYGGIVGVLSGFCEEHAIPYVGIPVGTIKKAATGRGSASKADMMNTARHRWPQAEVGDDNEADALWCAEAFRLEVEATRKGAQE